MTNTQLAELLLVRLYDLAEAEGHGKWYSLNEIAAEFGVTDKGKVFNIADALEDRGLIQASFTMGPAVNACIKGEGTLFVEQGGNTGVIQTYRENPQIFSVAIDQSTHFYAPISGSNVAVHSGSTSQNLAQPSEILAILADIEASIRETTGILEERREEALSDVAVLKSELSRKQPRRPIVEAVLATLGDLSSITSLLMQLQPLLAGLPWLTG